MDEKQGFEVEFYNDDDGLCAQRASASYFVDTEESAKTDVAMLKAKRLQASYKQASWLE